jgi:SAM-dependent methyltransferase
MMGGEADRAGGRGEQPVPDVNGPLQYAGIALVMMSNLMFELLITRIFSATLWYHFAFMAVSIALFGTTVGAVVVHLWPRHFAARGRRVAARYALAYAASIIACTAFQLRLNVTFGTTWPELARLTALYVLVAVPFTLAGVFMCLVLVTAHERIGAVYAADLIGAAVGCALFVPFAAHGEGPRGVLLLGALAACGAGCAAAAVRDRWTGSAALIGALLCAAGFAGHVDGTALRVRWAKGHPDPVHAFEEWNAFSRLLVDPLTIAPFGWGMGARFAPTGFVEQRYLTIDGAAGTIMTGFDGDLGTLTHLQWDVTALVYAIRPSGSVLVVGVGGGRDILTALTFGHRRVVGVEVNGGIVDLLRGPFADFTGHLDRRPDVELVHDEARSYVARTGERFDVIQVALADTWAAAANGAYVLSENALYTQEAFGRFLERLTPDGILSLSRWYFDAQPGETLRLVSLASTVLRQRGVARVQDHLVLVHNPRAHASVATLLISPRPFTTDEIERVRQWCAAKGFEVLLAPDDHGGGMLAALAGAQEPADLLARYPVDLRAPTDDRPFFFNMLRLRDAFWATAAQADIMRANARAVVTLAWLFVGVIVLSAVFILGPLWLRRAAGGGAALAPSRLVYFGGLGLGFILIELSVMQRLMIALGHPVYGLTVVLFALLVAAGLGSLWTQHRVRTAGAAVWLQRALGTLVLGAVLTGLAGAAAAGALEGAPTWVRISGSVLLLFPLGVLLGLPLATGLALSASDPPGYRALYWGVNGAASVCGSVLATMLSLAWGTAVTYGTGVLAYAVCLAVARRAFGRDLVRVPQGAAAAGGHA